MQVKYIKKIGIIGVLLFGSLAANASTPLIQQNHLSGKCIPRFAVPLPVFGPSGVARVDAYTHSALTVTMKEIDQRVLPKGTDTCGKGIKFHETRVWAYETSDTVTGEVLGPANWPAVTLEAQANTSTKVQYVNALPSFNPAKPRGAGLMQGLLSMDQTLHWADPLQQMCGMAVRDCSAKKTKDPCCLPYTGPVPATVHLHGGVVPASYDGSPESWYTPDGQKGHEYASASEVGAGKAVYEYPNVQEPGTLWIHDHALGITRLNVQAGLAGFYFLRDARREPKNLPSGAYEIEMAIQDRQFDTTSQLYFPTASSPNTHSFWTVVFEGDVAMVNGVPWPYLDVEPRRYRFRLLNGSNHRGYSLSFGSAAAYQIGADEGYFNNAARVDQISLAPGECADVIVDFSKLRGQNITLTNSEMGESYQLPSIMQFRVKTPLQSADTSCNPERPAATGCAWPTEVRLTDGEGHILPGVKIDKVRQLVINENFDLPTALDEYINNTEWDGLLSPSIAAGFSDGISEAPRVGSVELWEIINLYMPGVSMQFHPMHTHLTQFQVLNRQEFNLEAYVAAWQTAFGKGTAALPSNCNAGEACPGYGPPLDYNVPNADGALGGNPALTPFLSGNPIPPSVGETGWKDTAVSHARQVLRLLVRVAPTDAPLVPNESYSGTNLFPFDPTEGTYAWHCHILNHEDNEMMRPYKIAK